MSFSDRIEQRDRTGIEAIGARVEAAVREPFDALEGRVLPDDDAPDPIEYDDSDNGRAEYLKDCWEYAFGELHAASEELAASAANLTVPQEPPGEFPFHDRQQNMDDEIIAVLDQVENLVEARKKIEAVENEIFD